MSTDFAKQRGRRADVSGCCGQQVQGTHVVERAGGCRAERREQVPSGVAVDLPSGGEGVEATRPLPGGSFQDLQAELFGCHPKGKLQSLKTFE